MIYYILILQNHIVKTGDISFCLAQRVPCKVCWNVKAAVNWHHAQIFDRGLTLCEKATVWYLQGVGKKITFSVGSVWRIACLRSALSHGWRMSGQRRLLLVSTTKVLSHDSDRTHLVRGTDGHLDGASPGRRCHSLSFECHRLSEKWPHVISSHTHSGGKSQLGSVCDVTCRLKSLLKPWQPLSKGFYFYSTPATLSSAALI